MEELEGNWLVSLLAMFQSVKDLFPRPCYTDPCHSHAALGDGQP